MAINLKNLKFFSIIFFTVFCCGHKSEYNPKLVDYLKAERELRKHINQSDILQDSLQILQKSFKINPEKELKKLENNPDIWVKLLKEIDGEKQ